MFIAILASAMTLAMTIATFLSLHAESQVERRRAAANRGLGPQ